MAKQELSKTERVAKALTKKALTAHELAVKCGYGHLDVPGRAIGRPLGSLVKAGRATKSTDRVPKYARA